MSESADNTSLPDAVNSNNQTEVNKSPVDHFAKYLAKRLVGDKGYRLGVPKEAAALADASDIVLSYADLGLVLACMVDREADTQKPFSFSQQQLIEIGRACLKYTGTMNGTKMPVSITLYEIGKGPPSEADRHRLKNIQRTFPGFTKVSITCFYLDIRNKTVWTSAPLQPLLGRVGHRGWLDSVLQESRKTDDEIFVADAAFPQHQQRPLVTAGLLALLVALFVVEQFAKIGSNSNKGAGLFGIDAATLFALGGMNVDAVRKNGEWYRILAATLLHADAFHLLFNGLALWLAGYLLESLLGRAWFLSLFFLGAVGGSLMGLLVNPPNIVSVGVSGAVMGLLAAALVVARRFPPGVARTQIQIQILQFLIPSLLPLATHRQSGHVDFAAHFGGAIVGGMAGYGLMKIWPKQEEQPRFQRVAKGLAAIGIACFAVSLFLAKEHYWAYAPFFSSGGF